MLKRVHVFLAVIMTISMVIVPAVSAQQAMDPGTPDTASIDVSDQAPAESAVELQVDEVATEGPTPEEDAPVMEDVVVPESAIGSISVLGLDGAPAPNFTVINGQGMVLMSGVLDQQYAETNQLSGEPGTVGTLIVNGNDAYQDAMAIAVADETGAFHFEVTLIKVEPTPTATVDDEPELEDSDIDTDDTDASDAEGVGVTEEAFETDDTEESDIDEESEPSGTTDTINTDEPSEDSATEPVGTAQVVDGTPTTDEDASGLNESVENIEQPAATAVATPDQMLLERSSATGAEVTLAITPSNDLDSLVGREVCIEDLDCFTINEDSNAILGELAEGTYKGTLVSDGSAYRDQTFEFEVVASDDPLIIPLVWERGLGSITIVGGEEHVAPIGTSVRLLHRETYTWIHSSIGPNGGKSFQDLEFGTYEVHISLGWGYEEFMETLILSVEDPDFTFTPEYQVRDTDYEGWANFQIRSSNPGENLNGRFFRIESISDPEFSSETIEITNFSNGSAWVGVGPYPYGDYQVTLIGDDESGYADQTETFSIPGEQTGRFITWVKQGFSGVVVNIEQPSELIWKTLRYEIKDRHGNIVVSHIGIDTVGSVTHSLAPGTYTYSYSGHTIYWFEGLEFTVPENGYVSVPIIMEPLPAFHVYLVENIDGTLQPLGVAPHDIKITDSASGQVFGDPYRPNSSSYLLLPAGTYDIEVPPSTDYLGAFVSNVEHGDSITSVTIEVQKRGPEQYGTVSIPYDNVPADVEFISVSFENADGSIWVSKSFTAATEVSLPEGTYQWSVLYYVWISDYSSDIRYETQNGTIEVIDGESVTLPMNVPTPLVPFELWVEDSYGQWTEASVYINTDIGQHNNQFNFGYSEDGWYRGYVPQGLHVLNISPWYGGGTMRVPITVDDNGYSGTIVLQSSTIELSASQDAIYGSPFTIWGEGYEPGESVEIRFGTIEGPILTTVIADEFGAIRGQATIFDEYPRFSGYYLYSIGENGRIGSAVVFLDYVLEFRVLGPGTDGALVPMEDVEIRTTITSPYWNVWGETIRTDETGVARMPAADGWLEWEIDANGLTMGARGSFELTRDGAIVTVNLESYEASGKVIIPPSSDSEIWSTYFEIVGSDGWRYTTSLYMDDPQLEIDIPTGDYIWTASASNAEFVDQSGTFSILDGGTFTLSLTDWERHPEARIVLMSGEGEDAQPVAGVQINLRIFAGPWFSANGVSDENGVVRLSLPDGTYRYSITGGPSKWDRTTEGYLTLTETNRDFLVVLTELPNATLTVNVNAGLDLPDIGVIDIYDAENGGWIDSQYVNEHGTAVFDGLPTGKTYRLIVSGNEWYDTYEHPVFIFEEDTTIDITLTPYPTVDLTIIATSTTSQGLPTWADLQLWPSSGGSHFVELTTQSDGTLLGTITLPAREYEVGFAYWQDDFYQATFPALDLTDVGSEYTLNLEFTPADHGFATFDFGDVGDIPISGSIEITQDGSYVDWVSINPGQSFVWVSSYLLSGEYDWEFMPGGPFSPQSGSFTIANADVTVPVDLDVLANGVIILDIEFPETDIEDPRFSNRAGYVIVRDGEGNFVADVSVSDLNGSVAISPLAFGTYTVSVNLNGQLWQPVAPIEVTVNAPEVTRSIAIGKYQTTTVTFEATGSGRPVEFGGINLCDPVSCGGPGGALYLPFDEDGKAIFEHVMVREYRYIVYSDNYETVIVESWTPAPNETVTVNLGTERHRVIFTVTDQFGNPVEGLNYAYATCDEGYLSGLTSFGGGQYHAYVQGTDVTECSNVRIESSPDGVFQGTIIPTLVLESGSVTNIPLQLQRAEDVVSDITVTVVFPDGHAIPDGSIEIQMQKTDGSGHTLWIQLDDEGVANIPLLLPGAYDIAVYGSGEQPWPYQVDEGVVSITESGTSHVVTMEELTPLPSVPVKFVVETSDNGTLQNATPLYLYQQMSDGHFQYWTAIDITDEVTMDLPAGTYYASVSRTGLYWPGRSADFIVTLNATNQVVPIPILRVAAIGPTEIIASIGVTPSQGGLNEEIQISGTGFDADEWVDIYWGSQDGNSIQSLQADSEGAISGTITVPAGADIGAASVIAVGRDSEKLANTEFLVLAELVEVKLSAKEATAGQVIIVEATGLQPGETVEMFFGAPNGVIIRQVTASSTGTVSTGVAIPVGAALGPSVIEVVGLTSEKRGTADITVVLPEADVTLTPAEAEPGWVISVSASGFQPNETVEMFFGSPDGRIIRRVNATSNGTVITTVTVPVNASMGESSIEVVGLSSGQRVVEPFTVTAPVEPQVTLGTSSGDAGDRVTVAGTGFIPYEQVQMFFGSPNGVIIRQVNASSEGTVSTGVTIPVRALPGSYLIEVTGSSGKSATAPFTIVGVEVSLGVAQAAAGEVITVNATGLQPDETVEMFFGAPDGVIIRRVNANSSGVVSTTVIIPVRAALGPSVIEVVGLTSEKRGTANIAVVLPEADVTLTPSEAEAGWVISVNAVGFQPGETVEMFFGSPDGRIIRRVTAASNGAVNTTVIVPVNASMGVSSIEVVGLSSGTSVVEPFTVTAPVEPRVTLGASTGEAGDRVTVSATGFIPYEQVQMFFGSPNGVIIRQVNASSEGTVSTGVTIPVRALSGSYLIEVTGSSGKTATAPFTLPGVEVSLGESDGEAGDRITVTASGFGPNEQVEMFFGSPNGVIIRRVNANNQGTVHTGVTIPVNARAGTYLIEVRSASGKAGVAPFTVNGATASLSTDRGAAGTVIYVTASGFAPGEQVEMFFGSPNGVIIRRVNVSNTGSVVTNVTIPVSAQPGASTIVVRGAQGKAATATFTVTGHSAQVSPEVLMVRD